MPNPSWPVQLPDYVLQEGFAERLADTTIENQTEGGVTKTRQRFTAKVRVLSLSVKMTYAQAATFETFYEDTCAGGAIPFDWVHPRYRTPITFKFRKPPPQHSAPNGDSVVVAFQVETVP